MPRTAVTITQSSAYLAGDNPTATVGDAANDHSVSLVTTPICLVVVNTNAATVDFTIELPASRSTWNETVSVSHTVPAASGGLNGIRTVWIDVPGSVAQSGNVLHIDSADANFADVRFYAVAGRATR